MDSFGVPETEVCPDVVETREYGLECAKHERTLTEIACRASL